MAERLCRDALADFPDEPNLLSLLGAALNHQGRGREADPLLRRALEEEPGYAKGYEELGRSLLQLGRPSTDCAGRSSSIRNCNLRS